MLTVHSYAVSTAVPWSDIRNNALRKMALSMPMLCTSWKTKDYCKTNAWVDSGPDIDICIEQWVCILGDVLGNGSRE